MTELTIDYSKYPDISNDENKPNYAHPFYLEILPNLSKVNDIYQGITAWFYNGQIIDTDKAVLYLPPNTAEETDIYISRLRRSRFERVFRDAIKKDYSGLLTQISFNEIPNSFEENQNNIDLLGNNTTIFFKNCDELALRDGSCFILVEYPKITNTIHYSLADKQSKRPYLVVIERKNLINWTIEYVDGEARFTFAVIVEKHWENKGLFGKELVTYYRVLRQNEYQIYKTKVFKSSEKSEVIFELIEEGITGLNYIPLVGYSLTDSSPTEADFPLLDLADLNIELYQVHSEKREMIHHTVPTLQINERDDYYTNSDSQKRAIIGPQSILWNVDAKWIEPSGNGIEPTQKEEAILRESINEKTLGFLSGNFVPKTATEVELDSVQSSANLKGLAEHKESIVNTILKYWSLYDGFDYKDGSVSVNKELIKPPTQWTVDEVINAVAQGFISQDFGMLILQRSGLLEHFSEDEIRREFIVNNLSVPGLNQEVLA
jgi:hypothetical protein